jgi:ABC-type sugar transport system ATPase subunit
MSVLDNVLLGQHPTRWGAFIDKAAARIEAKRRLELLGVGDIDMRATVGSLPIVDQAFVQIARGLGDGARVFLLDEPTAPMDDAEVTRFLKVLKTAAAAGASIVYISHRLDEVFKLADRIVVLRDGHLAGAFVTTETSVQQVVSAMVGGRSLIQEDRVTKASSTQIALDVQGIQGDLIGDFSLRLPEGELCCIYGISGSGREEIGGLISGAARRKRGQVILKGREIPSGGIARAIRLGLGYVPAERRSQGLMIEASVAANLTLAILGKISKWGFLSPSAPSRRALHWIKSLSIKARSPEAPVGSLSGGSQQKVLLARWLAADSDVLVLEEPTRGVDIATKSEIYELLRSLASRQKTVLVVTSDIEEAALIGQRVVVVQYGSIVAELSKPTQEEIALAAHVKKGS